MSEAALASDAGMAGAVTVGIRAPLDHFADDLAKAEQMARAFHDRIAKALSAAGVDKTLGTVNAAVAKSTSQMERFVAPAANANAEMSKIGSNAMKAATGIDGVSVATSRSTAATRLHQVAVQADAAAMRASAFAQRNLVFQLNDTVVSLASGMSLQMVALQQGSQIFQNGVGNAFRSLGSLAGNLATKFAPVLAVIGAAALAVGGLTNEINKNGKQQVTWLNVLQATWEVATESIMGALRPITNWLGSMWDDVTPYIVGGINNVMAVFDLVAMDIKTTWSGLGPALGDLLIQMAENVANTFVNMGREVMVEINSLIAKINGALYKSGIQIPTLGSPSSLGWVKLDNPYAGAADKLGSEYGQNEALANSRADTLFYTSAIADRSRKLAAAHEEAAKGADKSNVAHKKLSHEGLSEADKAAQKLAQTLEHTLGSALGSLFDGPLTSVQDAMDGILGSFAQLGQSNLQGVFDGMLGGTAANDNNGQSWTDARAKVFGDAVEKGAHDGSSTGLASLLKGIPGGAATVGAGLGGLGVGYQTQNPLMGAAGGALAGMSAGPWGAVIGGIAGFIGGLIGMNEALEKSKKALAENKDAIDAFIATGLGHSISSYASALAQFNAQGVKLIELAKAAGDSALAAQIQASIDAYRGTLATQFNQDIQSQINDLTGRSGLNDVNDALQAFSDNLASAAFFGQDAAQSTELLGLELQKIVNEGGATADQIAALAAAFPDLAAQIGTVLATIDASTGPSVQQAQAWLDNRRAALRVSYEKESAALQAVNDNAKRAIQTLTDFKNSLNFGAQSPLSPYDQMMAAKALYDTTSASALGGNQDAIAKLPSVMQDYLQTAQGYYANSAQYAAIFDQVNATLDQALAKATSQVSTSQLQLDALNKQVSSLIDINQSVLSIGDAIRAVLDAQGGVAAAGGFDAQSYWSSDVKNFYSELQSYKSTTGAATIPAEIAGVWNAFASATSAAQYDQLARQYAAKLDEITQAFGGTATGTAMSLSSSALTMPTVSSISSLPSTSKGSAANGNAAVVAAVNTLRATVEKHIAVTAAGAQATVEAVGGVSASVDKQTDGAALQALRRPRAA